MLWTTGFPADCLDVMSSDFHESFSQQEPAPPSERSTGLVFVAVAIIVAIVWRGLPGVFWSASLAALLLSVVSVLSPTLLKPLNTIWFQIGLLLHRVMGPLVLFLIFAVVFVPAGLLMRIWYDPLRSKRAKQDATYWIARSAEGTPARSMENQF
jgi:hypothetical protein